jgi:hypothetical protein
MNRWGDYAAIGARVKAAASKDSERHNRSKFGIMGVGRFGTRAERCLAWGG